MNLKHNALTKQIIHAYFEIYNRVGFGFEKSVYKNGLVAFLRSTHQLHIEVDKMTKIFLEMDYLGEVFVDLVVENNVLVHITADDRLLEKELKRLHSFLKHSDCTVGLLLNFGIQTEFKRIEIP